MHDDLTPHRIADETYLVPGRLDGGGESPYAIQLNSMVIRGRQPVIVDTGAPINGDHHVQQIFGLVDPADVRWVFVSHEDIDHAGNVDTILAACPAATLATSWLAMMHLVAAGLSIPPDRWRPIADGDVLDIGDRVLVVERPPLYDSPATFGLFDTETEVMWAADCFASASSTHALDGSDVDDHEWRHGFVEFQQWHSPWIEGIEGRWWNHVVDRLAARRPKAIASCHGPVLRGAQIATAIALLRELPEFPARRRPEQATLDELLTRPDCRQAGAS